MTVRLRGRRLGDIDRVRAWKGLLQPLIQGVVEPALLGVVDLFGTRAWPGHGYLLRLIQRSDLADASSVLDDNQSREYKPETPMKHFTCIEDLRQLHKRRVPK